MGLIKTGMQLGGAFAIAKTVTNAMEKHDREKYNHAQNFTSPPPPQGSTGQQHGQREHNQQYASQEGYQYQEPDQSRSFVSTQDRAIEYEPQAKSFGNDWSQKPHQVDRDSAQQALQQSPRISKH